MSHRMTQRTCAIVDICAICVICGLAPPALVGYLHLHPQKVVAEGLARLVHHQGTGGSTAQGISQHEVQGHEVIQVVPFHIALDYSLEMLLDLLGCHLLLDDLICLLVLGHKAYVAYVPLISRASV